jgi:hypothetical protein
MAHFYEPTKNMTDAYYSDGTHEWFGKAPKGTATADSSWQIIKMEYSTGSYKVSGSPWIIKYPVDPVSGLGTDAPKFSWDLVGTYTYNILGC